MKFSHVVLSVASCVSWITVSSQITFQPQVKPPAVVAKAQRVYERAKAQLNDFSQECNFIFYKSSGTYLLEPQFNDLVEKYHLGSPAQVHTTLHEQIRKLKKQYAALEKTNHQQPYSCALTLTKDIQKLTNDLIKTQAIWNQVFEEQYGFFTRAANNIVHSLVARACSAIITFIITSYIGIFGFQLLTMGFFHVPTGYLICSLFPLGVSIYLLNKPTDHYPQAETYI